MKALFIKDWKLLKNQGKMFGAVLVFYGLLAVMDNSMGQSILGFFPFLFGLFTISTISYDEYQHGMTLSDDSADQAKNICNREISVCHGTGRSRQSADPYTGTAISCHQASSDDRSRYVGDPEQYMFHDSCCDSLPCTGTSAES